MKIAVFSDIHGNFQALEAIIKEIKKEKIDRIICLGDVIGIGPDSKKCLDLVMENNIEMTLGNHELYYLNGLDKYDSIGQEEKKHHQWIHENLTEKHKNFLKSKSLFIQEENMLFEHFLIENESSLMPFYSFSILKDGRVYDIIQKNKANVIFIGHEHQAFSIYENNKTLYDLGSSGCLKDNETFYTIINVTDTITIDKKIVTYNRDEFILKILEYNYPERETIAKIFFGIEILDNTLQN